MKKTILRITLLSALALVSCKKQIETTPETKTEVVTEIAMTELSFGVRGNCGMCKVTIEKAANGVSGVSSANWNVNKKKIDISFDATKTTLKTIHNAIAASGYDTDKVAGNLKAYDALVKCCQYDHAMLMNQPVENNTDDHSGHKH